MNDQDQLSSKKKKGNKLALIILGLLAIPLLLITIGGINLINTGIELQVVSDSNPQSTNVRTLYISKGESGFGIKLDQTEMYEIDLECLESMPDDLSEKSSESSDYKFDFTYTDRLVLIYMVNSEQDTINQSMDVFFDRITSKCGRLM